MKIIMYLAAILSFIGCAPTYYVSVNGYAKPVDSLYTYYLTSADTSISIHDIQFIEFSNYLDKALKEKNMKRVLNLDSAEVLVSFMYKLGNPKDNYYTQLIPIVGKTGVSSSTTTENSTLSLYGQSNAIYGNANSSSTTTYTPEYGVTGYVKDTKSYTTFPRFIFINAIDIKKYRDTKQVDEIWRTIINSEGSSNDLRGVIPIMIFGTKEFIAMNTKRRIDLEIHEDNSDLQKFINEK